MEKPFPADMKAYRDVLGVKYLKGTGIEIGAGHVPTAFDAVKAQLRYVDYLPIDQLREVIGVSEAWKKPDVVDDGQTLSTFKDGSLNFIVANHMLEHTEDPIGVLRTWIRKISSGGLIYVTVPDRRFSFDRLRPLTDLDHLIRDHEEGPQWSKDQHYLEFSELAISPTPTNIREKADELIRKDYRIHFHVWDQRSFLDFLLMFDARYHPVVFEHIGRNTNEIIAILRV